MSYNVIEPSLIRAKRLKGFRAIAMDARHSTRDLLAAFVELTGNVISYQTMYTWRKRQGFIFGPRGGARPSQSADAIIKKSKHARKITAMAGDDISNLELAARINRLLGTTWNRKTISRWRAGILGHKQSQRNPHNGKAFTYGH